MGRHSAYMLRIAGLAMVRSRGMWRWSIYERHDGEDKETPRGVPRARLVACMSLMHHCVLGRIPCAHTPFMDQKTTLMFGGLCPFGRSIFRPTGIQNGSSVVWLQPIICFCLPLPFSGVVTSDQQHKQEHNHSSGKLSTDHSSNTVIVHDTGRS
jgi:hypothetical protein